MKIRASAPDMTFSDAAASDEASAVRPAATEENAAAAVAAKNDAVN